VIEVRSFSQSIDWGLVKVWMADFSLLVLFANDKHQIKHASKFIVDRAYITQYFLRTCGTGRGLSHQSNSD
jgi:hypothetical protein